MQIRIKEYRNQILRYCLRITSNVPGRYWIPRL